MFVKSGSKPTSSHARRLVETARAQRALVASRHQVPTTPVPIHDNQDGDHDGDDGDTNIDGADALKAFRDKNEQLFRVVHAAINCHSLPPSTLGWGKTDIRNKLQSLLHSVSLDNTMWRRLIQTFLGSIYAIATDMGTGADFCRCSASWFGHLSTTQFHT